MCFGGYLIRQKACKVFDLESIQFFIAEMSFSKEHPFLFLDVKHASGNRTPILPLPSPNHGITSDLQRRYHI